MCARYVCVRGGGPCRRSWAKPRARHTELTQQCRCCHVRTCAQLSGEVACVRAAGCPFAYTIAYSPCAPQPGGAQG